MKPLAAILGLRRYGRTLLAQVRPWLRTREALFITGSRQVGKTSLLYLLAQHLQRQGRLSAENFAFLDCDDPADFTAADDSPDDLLDYLRQQGIGGSARRPLYLLLDEIHLLTNPARLVKLLVDHHPEVKVLATGSSSTALRRKFSDPLPGRKQEFTLPPLSFAEYLQFRGQAAVAAALPLTLAEAWRRPPQPVVAAAQYLRLRPHWERYLIYGGYPGVAQGGSEAVRSGRLYGIFNDYVRRDVATLFTVGHLAHFTRLVRVLAEQHTGLLSPQSITSDCGLDYRTVCRYVEMLELTFIVRRLMPYSGRLRRRLIRSPKLYFCDNGVRNAALQNFLPPARRTDSGALVEAAIYQGLQRLAGRDDDLAVSFWRTAAGGEVDFVTGQWAIEVKAGHHPGRPPRAMLECMTALGLTRGIVFNRSRWEKVRSHGQTILFYPYWLLGA